MINIITRNKKLVGYFVLVVVALGIAGVSWAAFTDKGKVLGSSFSVGSSDLKLLEALSGGTGSTNLKDEINGPNFMNIAPNWTQDYKVKIYNNGSTPLNLTSNAYYETANDPDDLRSYIFVEPLAWTDSNANGEVETEEVGASLGVKSIIKWKTEGYDLGEIEVGEIKGLVLRFSAGNLSDTKQGKFAVYDFTFDAVQL